MTTLDLKLDGTYIDVPSWFDGPKEHLRINFTDSDSLYGIYFEEKNKIIQDLVIEKVNPEHLGEAGKNKELFHIKFDNCKPIEFTSSFSNWNHCISDPTLHLNQKDLTKPIVIEILDDSGKILDHLDIYPNEHHSAEIGKLGHVNLSDLTSIIHTT